MVRQWQELLHGERYSHSWSEALPDFVKLAEAFGAKGIQCKDPADLDDAIRDMLAHDGPVIFDCLVEKHENCMPMIPSGEPHNKMLLARAKTEGRDLGHRRGAGVRGLATSLLAGHVLLGCSRLQPLEEAEFPPGVEVVPNSRFLDARFDGEEVHRLLAGSTRVIPSFGVPRSTTTFRTDGSSVGMGCPTKASIAARGTSSPPRQVFWDSGSKPRSAPGGLRGSRSDDRTARRDARRCRSTTPAEPSQATRSAWSTARRPSRCRAAFRATSPCCDATAGCADPQRPCEAPRRRAATLGA